ncbi:TPA: FecCD family ABC transporter permease [Staphylococcus aureus]
MISSNNKRRQWIARAVFSILLFLGCTWSITSGEYNIPVERFFKTLIGQGDAIDELILLDFRLLRMMITILAGAALSISGAIVQSVTKNPIAEPGILGINAGGGFAIVLFIAIGKINADNFVYVLPLISILGGIATALIIFIFSFNKNEGVTPASMVLIGVGLQTALYGGSITIMSKFDDKQSDFIAAWFAGNIWGDEWPFVIAFLPWVLIIIPYLLFKSNTLNIIPYLLFKSNTLNIIHTGDNIARGLGVRLSRERLILFFIAVMLSSAAVAVAGSISFIGLMGPHIAKRIVGPRHQLFLPIAILVGACLLVIADTIGKIVLQPGGVPAGIVVAIIGAPYFLYLMYKTKNV